MLTDAEREGVKKLPLWAQRLIERLSRNADDWHAEAMAVASAEGTNVRIIDYSGESPRERGLPMDIPVRFYLADGGCVEVQHDLQRVQVRISVERDLLTVYPRSSNMINVGRCR